MIATKTGGKERTHNATTPRPPFSSTTNSSHNFLPHPFAPTNKQNRTQSPAMAIIQSLTVPRFPAASLAPITASSLSPLPATVKSATLPAFTGLRIRSGTSARHLTTARSVSRHAGRVVCESPDTATEVPSVTDSTFESLVLGSDIPCLVEFWAPWCGPCRMIHPIIDELAKEYAGKLKCFKVNTDESPSIATSYGIRSIPTVIIFKNGVKKDAVIGAVPKSTLTTSIEKFL